MSENGKHRAAGKCGIHCFMYAVIRNDLSAEYNKDPSTSLGMTIRENVWSEVRSQKSDV